MIDHEFDKLLNINSGMERSLKPFLNYFPYEPTPYAVLELLANEITLQPGDSIVDFGCGKGRLLFYLNLTFGVKALGIEMDEHLFKIAEQNRHQYLKRHPKSKEQLAFQHLRAEEYCVQPENNKFYFFNPFSSKIFIKVIKNIMKSVEKKPRQVDLILYYPSIEYISYIENRTSFQLTKEIKVIGEYEQNPSERILIYSYQPFLINE